MNELSHTVSGDTLRPAVLFLHGFMGSAADWRSVVTAIEAEHQCIAVDLPGHGASLRLPPEAYSIEGAALMLLRLLHSLDAECPAVVGYSMGGRLALYLALRHPERCSRLFLESASPGIEGPVEREARRRVDEKKAARLESGDLKGFLTDWYRQPLFASLARHEGLGLLRETIEARLRNDPGELSRSLRDMGTGKGPSLWGELGALQSPALAVAGELDEKYAGIAARMTSLSPRIRAAVVAGAGHNVRLEAPGTYLALLERSLAIW
jgi:2-succinyl-6-hydroxy-2,4-cyclohexadiene-1-carboxylate synthase